MIIFYTDYSKIGGVENLILNLCNYFYFQLNEKVKVICKKESYIYKELNNLGIDFFFIDVESLSYESFVKSDDILIRTDFSNLRKFKSINCKFVYWEVLPTILLNSITSKFIITKSYFINMLMKRSALFFMDTNSVSELQSRGYNINSPKFLQIPIFNPKNLIRVNNVNFNIIRLSYIGRDVEWKVYPLLKVIFDLQEMQEFRFVVNVYCESNNVYTRIIPKYLRNIMINYCFNTAGVELQRHLLANSDLHFSMGTSALEGAILGIPTVLLDYSEIEFPLKYRYKFIFESEGYSLGRLISNENEFQGSTIFEILQRLLIDYEELSVHSKRYALKNHEISIVANKINEISLSCKMHSRLLFKLWALMYYEYKFRKFLHLIK